jgi:hypothetical protein
MIMEERSKTTLFKYPKPCRIKGLSRSYQCPRGWGTLFSLSVSVSGKYGCCPGQTWGVGQEGQGLAMGINGNKILRNEVMNEIRVPVALAGTFMT